MRHWTERDAPGPVKAMEGTQIRAREALGMGSYLGDTLRQMWSNGQALACSPSIVFSHLRVWP